jgi:hypothetical protein
MSILDIIYAQLERPPVNCPVALIGYTRGAERYSNPAVDAAGQKRVIAENGEEFNLPGSR